MIRIGIILGSTRPNRNGEQEANWVLDIASSPCSTRWSRGSPPLRRSEPHGRLPERRTGRPRHDRPRADG